MPLRKRILQFLSVVVVINTFPASISDEPFNITVAISGAKSGTNYLRAELYKDGSKNYFGETFNGSDWYGGSDGNLYFPVQISVSSASATFQARLGKMSSTDYVGPGSYKLKVKRYTSSGSAATTDEENPVDVQINYNLTTPSPTQVPTVTSSPFPIVTDVPSPIAAAVPHVNEEVKEEVVDSTSNLRAEVLAEETILPTMTDSGIKTNDSEVPVRSSSVLTPLIFCFGALSLGIAAYPFVKKRIASYTKRNVADPKKSN